MAFKCDGLDKTVDEERGVTLSHTSRFRSDPERRYLEYSDNDVTFPFYYFSESVPVDDRTTPPRDRHDRYPAVNIIPMKAVIPAYCAAFKAAHGRAPQSEEIARLRDALRDGVFSLVSRDGEFKFPIRVHVIDHHLIPEETERLKAAYPSVDVAC